MLNVFYNSNEAEEFREKCISAGGSASVSRPDTRAEYYEVQWTHNKHKTVKQVIFGYPCNYDVIETLIPRPHEDARHFEKRCNNAYREAMHNFETPQSSRKVYLINY